VHNNLLLSGHILHSFGDPKTFGLKDLCNDWKAKNWNPQQLVSLYKSVGARYFIRLKSSKGRHSIQVFRKFSSKALKGRYRTGGGNPRLLSPFRAFQPYRSKKSFFLLHFSRFFRRSTLASLAFCKNFATKSREVTPLGIKKIKIFCSALDFSYLCHHD